MRHDMTDMIKQQLPYTEILRTIVTGLVASPTSVVIKEIPKETHREITIQVHQSDHGKILGVQGQNITALQLMCEAIGLRRNQMIRLKMERPSGDDSLRGLPYVDDLDWDRDGELKDLAEMLLSQMVDQFAVEVQSMGPASRLVIKCQAGLALANSLKTFFKAWGKAQGRRIHFLVVG